MLAGPLVPVSCMNCVLERITLVVHAMPDLIQRVLAAAHTAAGVSLVTLLFLLLLLSLLASMSRPCHTIYSEPR